MSYRSAADIFADAEAKIELAQALYERVQPIAGTPADLYLTKTRKIPAEAVAACADLRYLPSSIEGRHPTDHALVSLLRDADGEVCGFQAEFHDILGAKTAMAPGKQGYALREHGVRGLSDLVLRGTRASDHRAAAGGSGRLACENQPETRGDGAGDSRSRFGAILMPGKVTFKLEGAKEFERLLKELGPVPAGRLGANALMAGARVIAADARQKAPVRTGELRRSIGVRSDRGIVRPGGSERKAFVTARARHAGLVEFGTARIRK